MALVPAAVVRAVTEVVLWVSSNLSHLNRWLTIPAARSPPSRIRLSRPRQQSRSS